MSDRNRGLVIERLELVGLLQREGLTKREAAHRSGHSLEWVRKWWRRYRRAGEAALAPPLPPAPGPLAHFSTGVTAAVLDHRRTYPRLGARRARTALQHDPDLQGERLPDARTIHRAWVHAGLVQRRLPRDVPPPAPTVPGGDLHAVWEIDHQDHLHCKGLATPLVLQSIRAPRTGLTIGADLFPGPRGAHGVPEDALFDALRRRLAQWGRPLALSVDGSLRFLGQPQRQFPSRLELLCAGLHIAVIPIRPGRPTDHGAVERLHRTLDGVLLEVDYQTITQAQSVLDRHLLDLNERFPSRAKVCGGQPPLVAYPAARHSGRPYDPEREWETFDLAAVDRLLAGWHWHRQVGATSGQTSFADRNVSVGKSWRGQVVDLRFDPTDRTVVIHQPGDAPERLGPEIKRFHCPAFDQGTILGSSQVAPHPGPDWGVRNDVTGIPPPGGTPL